MAAFFSPGGSLKVNDGAPAAGRAAITDVARSFMAAFPDLRVTVDDLMIHGDIAEFHWTLRGTNNVPGGSGNRVCISGYEEWQFGEDGLIDASEGHFDSSDYERQLRG